MSGKKVAARAWPPSGSPFWQMIAVGLTFHLITGGFGTNKKEGEANSYGCLITLKQEKGLCRHLIGVRYGSVELPVMGSLAIDDILYDFRCPLNGLGIVRDDAIGWKLGRQMLVSGVQLGRIGRFHRQLGAVVAVTYDRVGTERDVRGEFFDGGVQNQRQTDFVRLQVNLAREKDAVGIAGQRFQVPAAPLQVLRNARHDVHVVHLDHGEHGQTFAVVQSTRGWD